MSTISVDFVNDTEVKQLFAIYDLNAADPTVPLLQQEFDVDQQVGPLMFQTPTDVWGQARWVSAGSGQSDIQVYDGSVVKMSVTG